MRLGWKAAIAISIVLVIVGCIGIAFLLDPGIFSSISSGAGQTLPGGNKQNTGSENDSGITVVQEQIITTATGVYCNCTETYSQG